MKTTNILLGIIAFLLFCNLTKGTSFNIIPQASAQTGLDKNTNNAIQKVQIVDIDPKVKIAVEPVVINGRHILPVLIVDDKGKPLNNH